MANCKCCKKGKEKIEIDENQRNLEKLAQLQKLPECNVDYVKAIMLKTGWTKEEVIAEYLAEVERIVRS